ncbi:DNA polymerase delta small subunit [Phtheirospermum japonicum]|uniref:DNA polymerase delta small subunit n=1 Tax=Phtheirospermum japonicum TaxID=374723 RepID=A0A830C3C3_9LAMI|nr:DNA polymerase delta small subunit [Phtheirospermum japonicum]
MAHSRGNNPRTTPWAFSSPSLLTVCFPAMTISPMEVDSGNGALQRKQSTYNSLDESFEIQKEMYRGQQYSQIYFARLHLMRTLLYSLLPTWKPHLPSCTVLGLEEGKECVIVGTLFKDMKLKPTILDEYSKERSTTPLVKPHNFIHSDDYLVLEDESGRVKLRSSILSPSVYVTDFMVEDILEADLPPQMTPPPSSALLIHSIFSSLSDHITGHLGDEQEQGIAAQIVQVVIAGDSVELPRALFSGQNLGLKDHSKLSEPVKELDILLTQVAAGIPIDIMPGANDPANFSMPQQPLNRCLFPGSTAYNTFRSCTNPHSFELDNVRFLGTSGQNIDDLAKYSDANGKLGFLERTLRWRHIAPTAPNTLGCYPFTDRDPFFIESCPHVYFVGNQEKYETKLIEGPEGQVVRLICIPRFSETGIAVVLNLKNLQCHTLTKFVAAEANDKDADLIAVFQQFTQSDSQLMY